MPTETRSEGKSEPRILIVDDDAGQRSLLDSFLRGQGFSTVPVSSGEEGLRVLEEQSVDMMISDVRMPGMSGLETLKRAREKHAQLPVLMVTAYADIRDAVGAMRDGAVNYLSKPIDLDELLSSVRHATGLARAETVAYSENKVLPPYVVAESELMRALFRDTSLIAASESRVLVTGESGAGKEVLADVIHAWSNRSEGPLVKVNCAAIPETLLEDELFGHEKGAFTGATSQRLGRFEQARGGTIFLDEIGEMSPALQAKLLRVTQDGTFQRIGSNHVIRTDARLLAATNRHLEEEVRKGRFREDLFYRLNVVELNVPPLRERREDILPLAQRIIRDLTQGGAKLSSAAGIVLQQYGWPGNVRELRNAMERASLLSRGELILPEHLPGRVRESSSSSGGGLAGGGELSGSDPEKLEELERQAILQALQNHHFNRSETARALGISRRTLLYKVQKLRDQGFQVDGP